VRGSKSWCCSCDLYLVTRRSMHMASDVKIASIQSWRCIRAISTSSFFYMPYFSTSRAKGHCSKRHHSSGRIGYCHHKMMTDFICYKLILCGQHCQPTPYVVGQPVVSDISVVRSCLSICSLSSEANNTNLLQRLLIAVLGTSILLCIPNTSKPTTWRRVLGDHR